MPTRAEKLRKASRQRRRIALLERAYIPRIQSELERAGTKASQDYANGGEDAVRVGMEEHTQNLQTILNSLYQSGLTLADNYLKDEFGKRYRPKMERKDVLQTAIDSLSEYWLSESFTMSQVITQTMLEDVRNITLKGVAESLGQDAIAELIQDVIHGLSDGRARTIARTESQQAVQKSQYDIIGNLDLPPYVNEWASSTNRVRESHKKADGQRRFPNNRFTVGASKLLYPSERGGRPEDVINCRCTLLTEFDEVEERG